MEITLVLISGEKVFLNGNAVDSGRADLCLAGGFECVALLFNDGVNQCLTAFHHHDEGVAAGIQVLDVVAAEITTVENES